MAIIKELRPKQQRPLSAETPGENDSRRRAAPLCRGLLKRGPPGAGGGGAEPLEHIVYVALIAAARERCPDPRCPYEAICRDYSSALANAPARCRSD